MAVNGCKWLETAGMAGYNWKWLELAGKGCKWLKRAEHWLETDWKLLEITGNRLKWLEIAGNGDDDEDDDNEDDDDDEGETSNRMALCQFLLSLVYKTPVKP